MCFSDEEQIEVHSDIKGKISDYDILKNVPTIDGVPVHGDITESGRYTDETPTAGSKKLITSGAVRAAMERGGLQGPKGDDGYSPRIEVVKIESGYRVNITDIDGTKYFDVICGENAPGAHTHDDRYYTESETENLISEAEKKSQLLITDLSSQTDTKLSGKSDKKHTHDEVYYSKEETAVLIDDAKTEAFTEVQTLVSNIEAETAKKLAGKSDTDHEHDDRYPTKSAVMASIISTVGELEKGLEEILAGKSDTDHKHNDLYYTETETDSLISQAENRSRLLVSDLSSSVDVKLASKSDKNHSHGDSYISSVDAAVLVSDAKEDVISVAEGLVSSLQEQTETKLAGKSNKDHKHNDLYYTEMEADSLISQAENRSRLLVSDLSSSVDVKLASKSDKGHNHDGTYIAATDTAVLVGDVRDEVLEYMQRYIASLEEQTETKLAGKSNKDHKHNDLYYTETETDSLISQAENRGKLLVSDLSSTVDVKLSGKSDKNHNHDGIYIAATDAAVLIGDAKEEVLSAAQELVISLEQQTETKLAGKSNKDHKHAFSELTGVPSDYVAEKGTLNGWHYRKWNSGTAECWGRFTHVHGAALEEGKGFPFDIALPFTLADNTYNVIIQPTENANKIRKAYPLTGTTAAVKVFIRLENSSSGISGAISATEAVGVGIHLTGRWK